MDIHFSTREAFQTDYDFLFALKKAAEYDAISAVFGWNEKTQQELHAQEWAEARPMIIEVDTKPIGSYLMQKRGDHYYFGRFLLQPEYQGHGIGSTIMKACIEQSEASGSPIRLVHLQGNRVNALYKRYGFQVVKQDEFFVWMERLLSKD